MGNSLELDLDYMRRTGEISDVLGRVGTLRLRLPISQPPLHYVVESKTLALLPKISDAVLNGKKTTRTNADARMDPLDYMPDINHQIAIRDVREEEAFNDFTRYLWPLSELRHEAWARNHIQDLKTLMRGRHIDHNRATHDRALSGNLRQGYENASA